MHELTSLEKKKKTKLDNDYFFIKKIILLDFLAMNQFFFTLT